MKIKQSLLKHIVRFSTFVVTIYFSWQVNAYEEINNVEPLISVNQLHADLDEYIQKYYAIHPAPFANVDPAELANTVTLIKSLAEKSMTQVEAWRLLSRLNPILADFHSTTREEFATFTTDAFTLFKKENVKDLIIDIRGNQGGNNDYWMEDLLPYIADTPYRYKKGYKVRINKHHVAQEPELVVGQVYSGEDKEMKQPQLDNALRFTGNVYLLISTGTYSSAIHFAITVQDYDFAKLVIEPTGGRAGTTGNADEIILANTRLNGDIPTVLFSRPKSDENRLAVQPDIFIENNPLNQEGTVETLIREHIAFPETVSKLNNSSD